VWRVFLLGLVGLAVAAAAGAASADRVQRATLFERSGLATGPATFHDTVLSTSRRLQAARRAGEWGGNVTASDGEVLQLFVSDAYPVDATVTQSLADFMVQLYHGSELGKAIVYVAPLDEVQTICGFGAGGCYDPENENIVVPGDALPDGTTKETILVHELGHNLARNRLNPPWPAVDWGTKRWATAMNVCTRTASGTAFPGDEGANYRLDPGEALAESYRVLNFDKQQWPNWTMLAPLIVDSSFGPTPAALEALEEDVLDPWTGPTVASYRGRIASVTRPARHAIATPLDGSFSIKLTGKVPQGASISLVDTRTGKVVARGARRVGATVCGQRSLTVLVRAARTGAFSATYATP
jgi:hypothetical protein